MIFLPFRSSLTREQKTLLACLAMYWISFLPLFVLTIMVVFPPNLPPNHFPLAFTIGITMNTIQFFPFSPLILAVFFSIPTVVSSLFVNYSNKKHAINLRIVRTTGIIHFTFLIVMSFVPVQLLIEILFNPSLSHYQSPVKAGTFIIILFFYCLFVAPVILFSLFLAALINRWDSHTVKS